jgi:hypothetical protein
MEMKARNAIQKFIDELPPEFEAVKHKAEKLLEAHRTDVIDAFVAGNMKQMERWEIMEHAEDYYEGNHKTI